MGLRDDIFGVVQEAAGQLGDAFGAVDKSIAPILANQQGPALPQSGAALDWRGYGDGGGFPQITPQPSSFGGQTRQSDPFANLMPQRVEGYNLTPQQSAFPTVFPQQTSIPSATGAQSLFPTVPQQPGSMADFYTSIFGDGKQAQPHTPAPVAGSTDGVTGDASKASDLSGTQQWRGLMEKAATEAGIPWQVLAAIMGIESGGQNLGTNSSGATGLMQVTASNWQSLANQYGGNLSDPWTNIRTAAQILADAHKQYGNWNDAAHSYLGWGAADANGTTGDMYVRQFNNNLAALGYGQIGQGPSGSPRTDKAISAAQSVMGDSYVWGGDSPAQGGFDCSGLVQWAFAQAGVALPRTAQEQYGATQHIKLSDAKAGDLLFFQFPPDMVNPEQGGQINHVAIYLGNGQTLQASTNGGDVHIRSLDDFYKQYLVSAGRVPMGGDLTLNHTGVDAPGPPGARVNAIQPGSVIGVGDHPDIGHYVVTFDGHNLFTYGHLNRQDVQVRPGDYVQRHETLGVIGQNGLETGPHVHIDVHDLAGNPVDPFRFF